MGFAENGIFALANSLGRSGYKARARPVETEQPKTMPSMICASWIDMDDWRIDSMRKPMTYLDHLMRSTDNLLWVCPCMFFPGVHGVHRASMETI